MARKRGILISRCLKVKFKLANQPKIIFALIINFFIRMRVSQSSPNLSKYTIIGFVSSQHSQGNFH